MANFTFTFTNGTFQDFTEYEMAKQIWTYVPPVLIVVGTIANILSILVISKGSMKKSNTMFYLMVLAFADIVVLYSGLLRYWIRYAFEIDIRLLSDFSCKFHGFIVYFSLDFTSWILVAVTVDRCICACKPFTAKVYCTIRNAKLAVLVISISLFLANCHLFWTIGIRFQADETQCTGLYRFNLSIWPWIDLSIFCVIPFTAMIICNIFITRQLILSMRRIDAHRETTAPVHDSKRTSGSENRHRASSNPKVNTTKTSSVTIMLLTVNCVFLVLTVPIVIYYIGYPKWYLGGTHRQRAQMHVVRAMCNILQYLNNTIHFFLYCLTGPRFRRDFLGLFSSKTKVSVFERSVTMHATPNE